MTILLTMLIGAASFTETYDSGVQAYKNENYNQAIDQFEELVYNRVFEPEVFYNLGNAYYRKGDIPSAIVNYERAIYVAPALPEAHANLQQVVLQTQQQLARPQPRGLESNLYFWHTRLAKGTSLQIMLLSWFLFWGVLIYNTIHPKRFLKGLALIFGTSAILFWGSWYFKSNPMELAVVQGDKLPVRIGTKETDPVRFELFSGDRVQIDGRMDTQVRIMTAQGDRGWLDEKYLIPVWPLERASRM